MSLELESNVSYSKSRPTFSLWPWSTSLQLCWVMFTWALHKGQRGHAGARALCELLTSAVGIAPEKLSVSFVSPRFWGETVPFVPLTFSGVAVLGYSKEVQQDGLCQVPLQKCYRDQGSLSSAAFIGTILLQRQQRGTNGRVFLPTVPKSASDMRLHR